MSSPVEVRLAVTTTDRQVKATLTYENVSHHAAYINRYNGCLDDNIGNNVFTITIGDKILSYALPMKKRRESGKDYVKLAAGAQLHTRVLLNQAYTFLEGRHAYHVVYEGFHNNPYGDDLLDLKSNEAEFEFTK